jgi:hypothetical protein
MKNKNHMLLVIWMLILVTCSDDNPVNEAIQESHHGILVLTISGVPFGSRAIISIEGPNESHYQVDSSAVLDSIDIGTYYIFASSIQDTLGFGFAPDTISQTVTIHPDETTFVSIDYYELENFQHLRFTTMPEYVAWHSLEYSYTFSATDDSARQMTYTIIQTPFWMDYDTTTNRLYGTPTYGGLGKNHFEIQANNGLGAISQTSTIRVRLNRVESGSWYDYTPHDFPHDGIPLEGDDVIVYSDASDTDIKQIVLNYAENALDSVKAAVGLTDNSLFHFPDGQSKIEVYAGRLIDVHWGGWAYDCGYLLLSWDHSRLVNWSGRETWYGIVTRHETAHAVEFLVKGGDHYETKNTWLCEGLAMYIAGSQMQQINSIEDLNNWLDEFSEITRGGNPIRIRLWTDLPPPWQTSGGNAQFFPMFALAVRYLVDPNGHGKSLSDIKYMWVDINSGTDFYTAFEYNLGISVDEYESNYFDLITAYLQQ